MRYCVVYLIVLAPHKSVFAIGVVTSKLFLFVLWFEIVLPIQLEVIGVI